MKPPIVVSYGVGRDSTALLVELHRRGIRPDAITFADVGAEKPATYAYIPIMQEWLGRVGFPPITIVRYQPTRAPYRTLEGNMIRNATLPGATFNVGTCTAKFKIAPQNKWTAAWPAARLAWSRGQRVVKMIGFECDEQHRLRRADAKAHANAADRARYEYRFPLMEWGYDLERCKQIIDDAGLPVPVKSACFFCPNQKPDEVHELTADERARVILMELVAEPYNCKVRGLWRRPRKSDGRPGSITEYILQQRLPFTPLTVVGRRVVLNERCQKARNGHTFDGPHQGPTLRQQLLDAGHAVPEVVVPENSPLFAPETDVDGDYRETDAHLAVVEAI